MKSSGTLNKDEESLTEERTAELGLGVGGDRREATDKQEPKGWHHIPLTVLPLSGNED